MTAEGRPESFSLKEAIETIEWQAERQLDTYASPPVTLPEAAKREKLEVEAVLLWLGICEKHQQDMFERIYAWRQYG